jgi:hypothetical protein
VIGSYATTEPLFAETLGGIEFDRVRTKAGHALLDSVVAVHRLRGRYLSVRFHAS